MDERQLANWNTTTHYLEVQEQLLNEIVKFPFVDLHVPSTVYLAMVKSERIVLGEHQRKENPDNNIVHKSEPKTKLK
jgi:hypothetical protein